MFKKHPSCLSFDINGGGVQRQSVRNDRRWANSQNSIVLAGYVLQSRLFLSNKVAVPHRILEERSLRLANRDETQTAAFYCESFQRSAMSVPNPDDGWMFAALPSALFWGETSHSGPAAVYVEILDLAFSSSLPGLSPPPLLTFVTTSEPVRSDSYEFRCT